MEQLPQTQTCYRSPDFGDPAFPGVDSNMEIPELTGVIEGGHMRRTAWAVTAAVTAAVVVGSTQIMGANGQENSDKGQGKQCSEATVRGDYGIQIQGTRPAPGGLVESVIGIVLRNYDGHGGISQVSNVKGSVTGTVPDAQSVGTYEVNADCTGIVRFQPAPGVLIEERLVIVDNGREIRTAVMVPAAVMITGVHQRVHSR